MKTLLLALPLVFSSANTHAVDFTGSWKGAGQMTQVMFGNKTTTPCSSVEITLEHLPSRLTIQRYRALCKTLDSKWGPTEMEIRDGKVFEDEVETGTLNGDTLLTLSSDGGIQYAFNLRLKDVPAGATPVLESYYGVRNGMGTIVIEGNLSE